MANTTNFNWETPDDTDLVKDGAAAIRTLGSSIDTSFVDLKGGTTGQNLRKASNTDLDFTFAGDATNTVVDAAGDLLYGTASDTLGRLAIGTAGQVLKVNSGATAPEWGAAAAASFVGCSIYQNAAQAISNNTETKVNCDLEFLDTDGFHSNVTNNSRITVPAGKGGKYYVTAFVSFVANGTGTRRFDFWRNNYSGSPARICLYEAPGNSSIPTSAVLSGVVDLAVGDYLELVVLQTSGGNLNLNLGGNSGAFSAYYLGA